MSGEASTQIVIHNRLESTKFSSLGEEAKFWSQPDWIQVLALPLTYRSTPDNVLTFLSLTSLLYKIRKGENC